ncbi:hypothetical protein U1Q18_020857, partial [Sarracenia purpurea var. burkii]
MANELGLPSAFTSHRKIHPSSFCFAITLPLSNRPPKHRRTATVVSPTIVTKPLSRRFCSAIVAPPLHYLSSAIVEPSSHCCHNAIAVASPAQRYRSDAVTPQSFTFSP